MKRSKEELQAIIDADEAKKEIDAIKPSELLDVLEASGVALALPTKVKQANDKRKAKL